MKKTVFFLFIVFTAITINAQSLDSLISLNDKLTDEFKFAEAEKAIMLADSLHPGEWEVKWRASRALVYKGQQMQAKEDFDEEAVITVYNKALEYANFAEALDPGKSQSYLRRAIVNGRIALFKGVFSVGDVVNKIRDDVDSALAKGNGGIRVQAPTHYVKARTHAKISEKWAPARSVLGLGWADIDTALAEYPKAIKLDPEYMMYRVDYAKALMREDYWEEAKVQLEAAKKCPVRDYEDPARLKEIEELMKEVNEELN